MYRNVINVFYAVAGSLLKSDRTGMKTSDLICRNSGTVFNELLRCHELREAPLHNHEQRDGLVILDPVGPRGPFTAYLGKR